MDASAANKFIFVFIILTVSCSGTMRELESATTTPPVFNPVTGAPSIVTIPSANNPIPPSNPTVVYNPGTTTTTQSWCVAKGGITETALQAALDYACGIGGADCSAIQMGASCYNPNTLENHASFAFNSYYQRNPVQTSCDFGGTAVITNVNPSSGSCIYTMTSTATPVSPPITTNPTTTVPPPITTTPTTPTTTVSPITTNPATTPTTPTTTVPPITTNPATTPTTPTTTVPPITTNPTPTDSGTIPISFGAPPMVSSGATNPALGGGTTGYGDGSSFPGNNSSSASNLEPFIGSVIVVVIVTIVF